MNPSTESIHRLEEKIAYLERHVTEQDKAMLEMSDDITRLSRELNALRERTGQDASGGGGDPTSDFASVSNQNALHDISFTCGQEYPSCFIAPRRKGIDIPTTLV